MEKDEGEKIPSWKHAVIGLLVILAVFALALASLVWSVLRFLEGSHAEAVVLLLLFAVASFVGVGCLLADLSYVKKIPPKRD